MKTPNNISAYFMIFVTASFLGFPTSKIPKLKITKEIASRERLILIKGIRRASKLQYFIIRTRTKRIDSMALTSIAIEKEETPLLSAFVFVSIRCVNKIMKSAQTILRII
jgi:hypothetical protein